MLITFLIFIGWILSVCLHEFGHAVVAYWGGDTFVKDRGYLTLNPLKYIDPNLSFTVPLLFLLVGGIPLPGAAVYIQKQNLRNRYWQSAVSAAGPLASIFVVLVLAIPFWLNLAKSQYWIWSAIAFLIVLNICTIIVNLLPIPPLDGYGIIEPWLPRQTQIELRKFSNYGIIALFMALMYFKPLNLLLWVSTFRLGKMLGVPIELVVMGEESFKDSSKVFLLIVVGILFLGNRLINPSKNLSEKGNQFLRTKKYQEAIASYDQVIQINPAYINAWYNRGLAFYYLQKYQEAIASYDKVIQINPAYINAWYNRGVAFHYLQKYQEAIASYDKVIQINPAYINAWYNRGVAFYDLQKYQEAIASYDKVIQINPAYINAWCNRGVALLKLQKYKEAIACYNKAIKINPEYPDAWYNKACCYAEQNNTVLAIKNLQKAISLDPIKFTKCAKTDSCFSVIREDDNFQKLIRKI